MLALLGAGAQGYAQGKNQADEVAFKKEQQDRQRTQWQREDQQYNDQQADQQAARTAMAPTETGNVDLQGPTQPGEAPLPTGLPTVNGKAYTDQPTADAAAATRTGTNPMMRAAAAVRDPEMAARFTQQGQQAELTGVQLDEAKKAQAAQAFDQQAHDAIWAGPEATAKFLSDSQADGKGGKVKFQAAVDPTKNTWQILKVGEDGTTTPFGPAYANDDNDRIKALYSLSKAVPVKDKLAHIDAQNKFTAERDEASKKLAIEQTRAEAEQTHYKAMQSTAEKGLAIQGRMQTLAEQRAAKLEGSLVDKMSEADKLTYLRLSKQSEAAEAAMNKAQLDPMFDPKNAPGLTAVLERKAVVEANMRKLEDKYAKPDGSAPAADPLGLLGADGKPKNAAAPSPAAAPVAAPTPAPAPAGRMAAATATPGSAANPTGDKVLNSITQSSSATATKALQPDIDNLNTLKAQLVAAGNSGDPRAIGVAGAKVEAARAAIATRAKQLLGSQADQLIANL
jgi:hypothetical protein